MTCHLESSYRRLTGKQATTSDSSRCDCKSSGAIFLKRAVFLVESSSFDWASFPSPQPGSQTAQPDYLESTNLDRPIRNRIAINGRVSPGSDCYEGIA